MTIYTKQIKQNDFIKKEDFIDKIEKFIKKHEKLLIVLSTVCVFVTAYFMLIAFNNPVIKH